MRVMKKYILINSWVWSKKRKIISWNQEYIFIKCFFWCRIHLCFVGWGFCKQNRWRHSVTVPSQDGGYVLLWQRYDNKMADMCYYGNVILHLQQYSHRLNLFNFIHPGNNKKFSYHFLLLLFFYLFAQPVTEMLVMYALHFSEIASNLTLVPCFELLNS